MLRKCNNNSEKAIRELKVEELLAMNLTKTKPAAIAALEKCKWDLNAAAESLITV